jgi:hypothetical protein
MDKILSKLKRIGKPKRPASRAERRLEQPPANSSMSADPMALRPARAESQPRPFRLPSPMLVGVGAVAVVALVIGGMWLWNNLTMPLNVTKIEMTNALSSRVDNPEVKSTFKAKEPIMLHFEYKDADVDTAVKFEVKDKDKKVVKQGSTTVLRPNDKAVANGQRFASLVNTNETTALEKGSYTAELKVGDRVVKSIKFEVE